MARKIKAGDMVVDSDFADRDLPPIKVLEVFEGEFGTMLKLDTDQYEGPVQAENFQIKRPKVVKVAKLHISLPDTPEIRKILEQLAGHTTDDIAEGCYGPDGDEPDPHMYEAASQIADTFTLALHPELS